MDAHQTSRKKKKTHDETCTRCLRNVSNYWHRLNYSISSSHCQVVSGAGNRVVLTWLCRNAAIAPLHPELSWAEPSEGWIQWGFNFPDFFIFPSSVDHIAWLHSSLLSDVTDRGCDWLARSSTMLSAWPPGGTLCQDGSWVGWWSVAWFSPPPPQPSSFHLFILPLPLYRLHSLYQRIVAVPSFSVWLHRACVALIPQDR